ncbi:MAG: single-stranded-DNA-specific exonuclease RecJ [Desulfonatronovibrionaceae bacterium]
MRWRVIDPPPDPARIKDLARDLEISPLLATLLVQRGYDTPERISFFLNPGLRYLNPLQDWPGVDHGADILAQSVSRGEKIAVWGDYDVDGITATALLKDFFCRRGVNVEHYIPGRLEEGYGLNPEGIKELAGRGVHTLVTVDCGISSSEEVALARELGMQVLITDHHLPGETLPAAEAIINPKCGSCPCPELAGVGVAFLLAAALNRRLEGAPVDIRDFLDLVALGSIADVVELTGQNRVLVKNGLLLLNQPQRPGIQALKEVCGLNNSNYLGSGQIGFGLAPRINAAGRLGNAEPALELLLAEDGPTARLKAAELDRMNQERRKLEESILGEARELADSQKDRMGLVLYSPKWHHGVIGIVASRIVEEFNRPCLILARKGGLLKGSGRSVSGFDLFSGLSRISPVLHGFGGHTMAAGLSVAEKDLDELCTAFDRDVRGVLGDTPPEPEIVADARVGFRELSPEFIRELEIMQPFGLGNSNPIFVSPPLEVQDMYLFGQNRHVGLELHDQDSGLTFRGKIWRRGEQYREINLKGKRAVVAYRPKMEEFKGLMSINLHINQVLEIS